MNTVDTRGKLCPMPLILLKKALNSEGFSGEWQVLTDNATACQNLTDYIRQITSSLETEELQGYTSLRFTLEEESCRPTGKKESGSEDYTVVLSSDTMGRGDDELGRILARAFVNALEGVERKPNRIVCYNRGVLLADKDTDTGATLTRLHKEHGVEVILCGTCVDYFEFRDKIAVGTISNMLVIAEYMRQASRLVTP